MRFYKLRVTPNAASIASTFNESFKPEIIPEANDPFRVNWVDNSDKAYHVGEEVRFIQSVTGIILFITSLILGLASFGSREAGIHCPMANVRANVQRKKISFAPNDPRGHRNDLAHSTAR